MAARFRARTKSPGKTSLSNEVSLHPSGDLSTAPPRDHIVAITISLVTLIVVSVSVFITPRMTGDTFMTIAGGQDVLDGKLGAPDDWAFTTQERVWINQSWGTGLLFNVAHRLLGYNGIVMIKASLICALGIFLVRASGEFGVRSSIGILVSSSALFSARHFVDMRANVVGLACLVLLICILYSSGRRQQNIWWGVVLITVWSHMHGSFVFGIGMMGLWLLINLAVFWIGSPHAFRMTEHWPLMLCTILAVILPAVTSPFGMANLTQPFMLLPELQTEVWPLPASEMRPIFHAANKSFVAIREFILLLSLLATPVVAWLLHGFVMKDWSWQQISRQRTVAFVFTLVLVVVAVVMSLQARRFVPLALLAATPLVAFELQWLLNHRRFAWTTVICLPVAISLGIYLETVWPGGLSSAPMDLRKVWSVVALVMLCIPILGSGMVAVVGIFIAGWQPDQRRIQWAASVLAIWMLLLVVCNLPAIVRYYRPANPFLPRQGLFGRMILRHKFPEAAAQFINDNHLHGNVFNDWKWEGFLRMHCPQLQVFLGGRSRQAYPASVAKKFLDISRGTGLHHLSQVGVRYLIISSKASPLYRNVMLDRDFPWQVVFLDNHSLIAANMNDPVAQRIMQDALAGELKYPSAETEKVSLAIQYLTDKTDSSSTNDTMNACKEATLVAPTPYVYGLLPLAVVRKKVSGQWMRRYLEEELRRLELVDFQHAGGVHLLDSRQRAAAVLAKSYNVHPQKQIAKFWIQYSRQLFDVRGALRQAKPLPRISPLPSPEKLEQMQRMPQ